MKSTRTVSSIINVGQVDDLLSRDQAFLFVQNYIQEQIPANHEFEYKFLDFAIQDGLDSLVQIMFSADVEIWSESD
jgi:hypothetical protein